MAKRTTKNLQDIDLRRWISAGKPLAKSDGDGLTFTLSANGLAAWVLRYRIGGRRKELHLGRYPDMGIRLARDRAAEKRLEIARGVDVALERQRDRVKARATWTVKELVRDYEAKVYPMMAPLTLKGRAGLVADLVSRFGTCAVGDISHDDAHAWLEGIAEERGYHAASNTRKAAVSVFKHALKRRKAISNPFAGVKMDTVLAKPETRRRIKLDAAELHAFLAGLRSVDETDALTWRLMLLTGVRAGEMISAEWKDIDFEHSLWKIPREKIKTRRDMRDDAFVIQLPADALGWLRRLHVLAAGSRWVLPARVYRHGDKPADHERVLARLKLYTGALNGCRQIVLHDLRSTMRSHLTSTLAVRIEVAEKCLNHKLAGLLGIYDASDYLPERATALSRWADYLNAIETGGNVTVLKKGSGASR